MYVFRFQFVIVLSIKTISEKIHSGMVFCISFNAHKNGTDRANSQVKAVSEW